MSFGFSRGYSRGIFPGFKDVFGAQNLLGGSVELETNISITGVARKALSEKASEEGSEIVNREIVPISSTLEEVTGLKRDLHEEELSAEVMCTASSIESILLQDLEEVTGLKRDPPEEELGAYLTRAASVIQSILSEGLEEDTGLKHDLPEEELSTALTRTASVVEPILPTKIQEEIKGLSFDEIVEQTVLKKWDKPSIIRYLWAVKEESQALKLINLMSCFTQFDFCEKLVDERNFKGLFEVARVLTDPYISDLAKRCIAVREKKQAIKLLSMIKSGFRLIDECRNLLLLKFFEEALDLAKNCLSLSTYKCEFFYDVYNTGYRGEKLFELALSMQEDRHKEEICREFIELLDCSKLLEVAYSIKYRSARVEKLLDDLIDRSLS
jgi:hypothetical protein